MCCISLMYSLIDSRKQNEVTQMSVQADTHLNCFQQEVSGMVETYCFIIHTTQYTQNILFPMFPAYSLEQSDIIENIRCKQHITTHT